MTDQEKAEAVARIMGWGRDPETERWNTPTRARVSPPSLHSWDFFGAMWEWASRACRECGGFPPSVVGNLAGDLEVELGGSAAGYSKDIRHALADAILAWEGKTDD